MLIYKEKIHLGEESQRNLYYNYPSPERDWITSLGTRINQRYPRLHYEMAPYERKNYTMESRLRSRRYRYSSSCREETLARGEENAT